MQRPVCALLAALSAGGVVFAACGTIEDEGSVCAPGDSDCGRPLDLEYMTASILAPSCGQAQCHSTFHQAGGLAFDTPEVARKSLLKPGSGPLLQFTASQYDPGLTDGAVPNLIAWLLPLNEINKTVGRMPFDAPLPNRDIDLLSIWIRAPFTLSDGTRRAGAYAKGAQCDPDLYGGLACNDDVVVQCGADFNFGEAQETCAKGCQIAEGVVRCAP